MTGFYPTFTGARPAAFTEPVRAALEARGFGAATTGPLVVDTGAPDGSATDPMQLATDAKTVGGYTAAQLLDRARQTGPWYCHWLFGNPSSGVVWRGSQRGSVWRVAADDADPAARVLVLEPWGAAVAGDVLLASNQAGVILVGRGTGQPYRVSLNDAQSDSPQLEARPVSLAQARADDFVFGATGFGPVLVGRANANKYLLCVVDDGGWAEVKLELGDW